MTNLQATSRKPTVSINRLTISSISFGLEFDIIDYRENYHPVWYYNGRKNRVYW